MRPYPIIPVSYQLQENTLAFLQQQMVADFTMPMPMLHAHVDDTTSPTQCSMYAMTDVQAPHHLCVVSNT